MRVLLAGASGVIGRPLLQRLRAAGPDVLGLVHSAAGAEVVESSGATAVLADALDRDAVLRAVEGHSADPLGRQGSSSHECAADTGHRESARRGRGTRCAPVRHPIADPRLRVGRPRRREDHRGAAVRGAARRPLRSGDRRDGRGGEPRFCRGARGCGRAEVRDLLRSGCVGHVRHDAQAQDAAAAGAPRPVRLPAAVVRLGAPFAGSQMLDMSMRVSNDRAANELGWRPRWPSYRKGLTTLG
ncbi:NAD-dependent epimerase/dehydratase family protein [Mycolicibacterium flavescens]|nr:NAD-dependent epimerase/dehydratase family protein [Mycolicibacterium flavescens]